jgi:putative stress-induced transcription regulator
LNGGNSRPAAQRQRGRGDERRPEPLDRPAGQQRGATRGEAAGQRGDGEHREPGPERPPAAHAVGEAPRGEQAAAERERVRGDHPPERRGGEAEVVLHGRQRGGDDRGVEDDDELGEAQQGDDHGCRLARRTSPSNGAMPVTGASKPPTAASMRLDGGHPALELVNTIYGQVGGPVEFDVLSAPEDLVTLARRVGLAEAGTPASPGALAAARALRGVLDPVLRALVAGDPRRRGPRRARGRGARGAGRRTPRGG